MNKPAEMPIKSAVSLLQEWCAKKRIPLPTYEFSDQLATGFECRVRIHEYYSMACAPSKREAKRLAAENLIAKLQHAGIFGPVSGVYSSSALKIEVKDLPEVSPIPEAAADVGGDMILQLRNYCILQQQPIVLCEVTHQLRTDGVDQFTATCKMRDVQTSAKSENELIAKQLASREMLRHFKVGERNEFRFGTTDCAPGVVAPVLPREPPQKTKKILVYCQVKNIGWHSMGGRRKVPSRDALVFFSRYAEKSRQKALDLIRRRYDDERQKVMDILKELQLKPKFSTVPFSKTPLLIMYLQCEFDIYFMDPEEEIFRNIVDYFEVMLL